MNDILQQFMQRDAGPVIQFIKYAICGGIATGIHFTVFYASSIFLFPALSAADPAAAILRRFGITVRHPVEGIRARNAVLGNIVAFFFSNTTVYLLNVIWVFQPGRHSRLVEVLLFFAVSATSMVIGTWLLRFLIRRFGFSTTVAFLSNIFTSLMINFVMRKFVVFNG